MDVIIADSLGKKIQGREILKDVSFEIDKGVIVGVYGKNGAGKTTLIRCLLGVYKKDKGDVYVHAENRKVIFDTPVQFKNVRVKDYLNYFSLLYENKKLNDNQLNQILEQIDLQDYKNKKVSQLSYGMKKKLYISTLLIGKTELAIIDEPFNGLDAESICMVKAFLKEIQQKYSATIFVVSHHLNELKTFCEKYILVSRGITYLMETLEAENRTLRILVDDTKDVEMVLRPFCEDIKIVNGHICDIMVKGGFTNTDIIKALIQEEVDIKELFYRMERYYEKTNNFDEHD